jgi:pyruvate kinase
MEKNNETKEIKIVCTIGPASESPETLKKLSDAGMNITRCNFSHGTHEEHGIKFDRVKQLRQETGRDIKIMLDTKGPDIRLKTFATGAAELRAGDKFSLYTDDREGSATGCSITHKDLPKYVTKGNEILINNGLVKVVVEEVKPNEIVCEIINGGKLSNKKSLFVPGVDVHLQFISAADRADLEFGVEQKVDMIAASFVNTKKDIADMREIVGNMPIIAKIESVQGFNNLDEIIEAADGIMVARGDLGVEYPLEKIPTLQKAIIKRCNEVGKFVITATEMMESMINNPRPTRAETTDVANAVYDGTDAIMLSAESATGSYPVETVTYMRKIADEALSQIAKKK